MTDKLIKVLKEGNAVVPFELIKSYKKINLTEQELIFIIYILNTNKMFNPKEISDNLNIKMTECLQLIESLSDKDIINIKTIKNNGITEEIIDTENLYKKIAYLYIENDSVDSENKSMDIYSEFEQEFGRTLSPIEYELIGSWRDINSDEIITLALKEAVYNGVNNLRYIDKILHEWNKKGLKTKEAIMKDKMTFANKKVEKKELFDYDWLNEE